MGKQIVLLQALVATPEKVHDLAADPLLDDAAARALTTMVGKMIAMEAQTQRRMQQPVGATERHPASPEWATTDAVTTIDASLAAFRRARQETVAYLKELPASVWQQRVVVRDGGEVTVRALVQQLVAHDATCLQRIRDELVLDESRASESPGPQATPGRLV